MREIDPVTRKKLEHEREIANGLLPSAMPLTEWKQAIEFPRLSGLTVADIGGGQSGCAAWCANEGANIYCIDAGYRNIRSMNNGMEKTLKQVERMACRYHQPNEVRAYMATIRASRDAFFEDLQRQRDGHFLRYVCGLVGFLPLPSDYVDFGYSINCLTHGIDKDYDLLRDTVNEAMRIIKPGGELQIYPFLGTVDKSVVPNHNRLLGDLQYSYEVQKIGTTRAQRLSIKK